MKRSLLLLVLSLGVTLIIGCGGSAVDDGFTDGSTSTSSTNGATNGSTSGNESPFVGDYDGFLEGSNTSGAQFSGDGFADIQADGDAAFWFDAMIGNVQYSRNFEGTVDDDGSFEGFTHTGERTTGTVNLDGDHLTATLTWVKRTINGQVFYTETENFSLFRQ